MYDAVRVCQSTGISIPHIAARMLDETPFFPRRSHLRHLPLLLPPRFTAAVEMLALYLLIVATKLTNIMYARL